MSIEWTVVPDAVRGELPNAKKRVIDWDVVVAELLTGATLLVTLPEYRPSRRTVGDDTVPLAIQSLRNAVARVDSTKRLRSRVVDRQARTAYVWLVERDA